jgi:alkanesulfonate monooxygenase SsuD/methylene tetrahydromethanopterin reductase-like flavin-dependent oxidoreductase (luciferase family)
MEFGLLLPAGQAQLAAGGSVRGLVDTAVAAERRGFDSVWVGDSLARARVEPLTLLAAVAQATERVTIGTAALIPAFRHPVVSAITAASLDQLSGGRLVLGVGGGFPGLSEPEFDLVGVRFKTRFSHLDDVVALWRGLWTGSPDSFHGKVLHYEWLPQVPRPHRDGGPPIWLAGATPAALRRAGRAYDGWLPYPPDPETYARGLRTIRGVAAEHRRNPDSITAALFATVFVAEDPEQGRRALDRYCQATYRMPLETVGQIQVMLTGPASQIAAGLAHYAGARHILLRVAAIEPDVLAGQLEMLPLERLRRALP